MLIKVSRLTRYDMWDEIRTDFKESPSVLNRNNDCKWFEDGTIGP